MEEVRKKSHEDNVIDEDEDDAIIVSKRRRENGIVVGCSKNLENIQDNAGAKSLYKANSDDNETRNEREDSLEKDVSVKKSQSPGALAFTIDFSDGNKELDTTKYQNIFQRYNARHKRNLSTSKLEIKASKSSADLSPNFLQKHKPVSIHSEGYFSSEDDTKRKVDKLSQKLKELGLKTSLTGVTRRHEAMSRSLSGKSEPKRRSYHEESSSTRPDLSYSSTMNDLSRIQSTIEDDNRSNRVQYSPEKKYTKNIEYIEINHSYSSDNLQKRRDNSSEKLKNTNYTPETPSDFSMQKNVQVLSISYEGETSKQLPNIDAFSVSNLDNDSDGTVSEAGTYTVHKDYTDEEKARMDIDKTFSVGILTEHERNESYVNHFKMSSSRDSNSWISDWATQVAEHNSLPPPIGGQTGRTPPMSPSKIPSPIYSRSTQRSGRSRYEQSDSSIDAEVQQRMSSNTMIDSGGESDEDTSNSYPTPPQSSQRTPTHSSLVRRGSLSETLFKRVNNTDCRRSMRKYPDNKKNDDLIDVPKSPSHMLARLHLDRSNSLDARGNNSDTGESNSSRRSSLRNYDNDNFKHTNSPILNRLRSVTPKLTNSPILGHKSLASKMLNSPSFERPKQLIKSGNQSKNIGYFTCVESSPYMLRKSNSTSNYREETSPTKDKLLLLHGSPMLQRNMSIQRSASNTSIRNAKSKSMLTRRSSFNDNGNERLMKSKLAGSDSSSETGEPGNVPIPPISSGIKLNRAFSIRRARLSCDSESTPNTTPEERRRKAQSEIKSAPCSARQPAHHRGRTSSVGANNKEVFKKPEAPRPRGPSLSRNEGGRYSMRGPKTSSASTARPNQKSNKDAKNSGRSNSTLTSKEVEFQNWKRRKNYDPMKAAAEGKKKLDPSKKHHSTEDGPNSRDNSVLRSASFHGTGGALSLADDWSDNELNYSNSREIIQPPPPCSPLGSDSDLDTSSYLQTTHNVMSAMSARITVYQPAAVDSGGESDEDTSHSLRQCNKIAHETSDTESSDEHMIQAGNISSKFNRNYCARRSREGADNKGAQVKTKVLPNSRSKSEGTSIARTDSGRFSMRLTKGSNSAVKVKPKDNKKVKNDTKEQEMQNWKRRKSYDPMKAALEGKRKAGLAKRNLNSESSSVLRSQSFHGPVTMGISEWSDEDISASADEAPIY